MKKNNKKYLYEVVYASLEYEKLGGENNGGYKN